MEQEEKNDNIYLLRDIEINIDADTGHRYRNVYRKIRKKDEERNPI